MPEIHELIQRRYSAVSFSSQDVGRDILLQLFEAARWASSCFNEQPWRFIFASKNETEEFQRIFSCLLPGNQTWVKSAPVLLLTLARKNFSYKERPNAHAWHDVGQAMAQFSLQAAHLSLSVHQMAGFDSAKARTELNIPEDYEPIAAAALGYPLQTSEIEGELKKRAEQPRIRKNLEELVFQGVWGKPFSVKE